MQADQCNSCPEVLLICFLINVFLTVGSELSVATSNNSCYASLRAVKWNRLRLNYSVSSVIVFVVTKDYIII